MTTYWKPVVGYEGLYEVSIRGQVKSLARKTRHGHHRQELILKTCLHARGYEVVCVSKDGKQKCWKVHRLVADAFLQNPLGFPQVNHKDGNKLNNCVENLEWVSASFNMKHAVMSSLVSAPRHLKKLNGEQEDMECAIQIAKSKASSVVLSQSEICRRFGVGFYRARRIQQIAESLNKEAE